jgi:hypothetical protein
MPDGFTVPRRVPRCGAVAASSRSKSSLKEGSENPREALEWAKVRARAALTTTTPLVCARQRPLQFPLRPYNSPHYRMAYSSSKSLLSPASASSR